MISGEGQQIGPFRRDQRGWLPDPMTRCDLDSGQDRLITGLRMLQRSRELVAVQRDDTIIMIAGEHQGRRVVGSGADVVQRRIRQRLGKLRGVLRIAVIGDPCGSDGEEMEAQQVQDTDRRQSGRCQVGMLCHHRTHQQATVTAAV